MAEKRKTIVFSDRDGTINKDDNYYLGSKPTWREQIEFLDGVFEGINIINLIPGSHFFILTNQSGVALNYFTEERMHEVNDEIIRRLGVRGLKIDGYFACPYVNNDYVEKAKKKGKVVNPAYVRDGHPDLKPNTGMVQKALDSLDLRIQDCDIYVIGDRASDVELGTKVGTGILVEGPKTKELGDVETVRKLTGKRRICRDYERAAHYIFIQSARRRAERYLREVGD